MTRMPETTPNRKQAVTATKAVGIVTSLAGIAVLVVALILVNSIGDYPRWQEEVGYFLIAVAGFLVSAAGTDLRHNAARHSG